MNRRETRLRPLGSPVGMEVCTDRHGVPVELRFGRMKRAERVDTIREVWRIDDEWWRRPISRLYYHVVLESGRVTILFRNLLDGSWHTH